MASRRSRTINLPAPYLKRIWLDPSRITDRDAYPFCLPLLRDDFELSFERAGPERRFAQQSPHDVAAMSDHGHGGDASTRVEQQLVSEPDELVED